LGIFRGITQNADEGGIIVDARLPNPAAILFPGQPIPITLVIKRDNGFAKTIVLQSVEIILNVITTIEIQGEKSSDKSQLSIFSKRNLNITLPPEREELPVCATDISGNGQIYFPRVFLPSFHSCNIARTYSLIVRVGLLPESAKKPKRVELVIAVQVYSGLNRRIETDRVEEWTTNRESDESKSDSELGQLPSYNDALNEARQEDLG
jgi:hypothetical protein